MSLKLLQKTQASIGVQEIPGPQINPAIEAYFADCGWKLREIGNDDTTAWCAAFVGSALKRCGYPVLPKDQALLARNYCTYGVACEPEPGAIGVIPRGTQGWMGHIFVIEEVLPDGTWMTIGGNQGREGFGQVSRAIVNPMRTPALAVRKPVEATVPALRDAGSGDIRRGDNVQNSGILGTAVSVTTAWIASLFTPATPDPLEAIPQGLGLMQQITTALLAVGKLLGQHPWLAGAVFVSVVLVWYGRKIKLERLARHKAGIPLANQVAAAAQPPEPPAEVISISEVRAG